MSLTGPHVTLPEVRLVHRTVEAHARLRPDSLALTCGDDRLSYAELNSRANRFAHHLMSRGVGRGSLVGVCLDRTPALMVGILGILKAGAAYVPLDPTYPRERLELMLSTLDGLKYALVSADTRALLGSWQGEVLVVGEQGTGFDGPAHNPDVEMTGDDCCYAVFTSGSTGRPKATAVRHSSWYNLLRWLETDFRLDTGSSGLSVSSFGFDISQRGLMSPLFVGAPLHLLPSRAFDPGMAYRLIGEQGVKTLHCAPSTLYVLIDQENARGTDWLTGVEWVFIGGEPLNVDRVREWATREGNICGLLHQYGVAECTDVASSHLLRDWDRYRPGATPVGRPVQNTTIWLLDDELAEVPDGATGEIWISGHSVNTGYLNASPADSARFTEVVLGGRTVWAYRTGDRGYATAEGELVVVGRLDAQVKIRGMRIDLGDVEHGVRSSDRVRDVVALALPDAAGEQSLVAFVIPAGGELDSRALRAELYDVLPRNMVPQEFVPLRTFPLNPNGKTDRRALAAAHAAARGAGPLPLPGVSGAAGRQGRAHRSHTEGDTA